MSDSERSNDKDKGAFTYKTEFNYLTKDQVKLAWKIYFPEAKLPKAYFIKTSERKSITLPNI